MSEKDRPEKPKSAAGRVRHDASGRAVWEWAIDTGRHAIDSTSRLLRRLELPGLSLEDDAKRKDEAPLSGKQQIPTFGGSRETDPLAGSRKSFNPYDNRSPPKRAASPPATRASAARGSAVSPAAKPGFFARLFGRR